MSYYNYFVYNFINKPLKKKTNKQTNNPSLCLYLPSLYEKSHYASNLHYFYFYLIYGKKYLRHNFSSLWIYDIFNFKDDNQFSL